MSITGIYDEDKDTQEIVLTKEVRKKHNTLRVEVEKKDGTSQIVHIEIDNIKSIEMEFLK